MMALMLLLLPLFGFQAFVMSCEAAEHLWAAANRAAPGGETILMPTEVERYKLFSLAKSTSSEGDLRALLDEDRVGRLPHRRRLLGDRAELRGLALGWG